MSFSKRILEDNTLQKIYKKIIFDEFHKKTKQLKQENKKSTCLSKFRISFKVTSITVFWK